MTACFKFMVRWQSAVGDPTPSNQRVAIECSILDLESPTAMLQHRMIRIDETEDEPK